MRCWLKKSIILILTIIAIDQAFAQSPDTGKYLPISKRYRTWSVGVSGGISTPYTLVGYNSRQDFTSPDVQWGYGIYIKDQLTHSFGLQADLIAGKLQADHAWQVNPSNVYIYSQFDTKLNWSASLSANVTIAHIYGSHHKGLMQPYLSIGGGVVSYTPVLHSYYGSAVYNLSTSSSFFVPIGAGIKIDLTPVIDLDLGYQVNYAMTDDIDGYKFGPTNDRFSYTHIGLEFALGKSKKPQLVRQSSAYALQTEYEAREKVLKENIQSQQAEVDQQKKANDKLQNDLDAVKANLAKVNTDSDGDGVPDYFDKCPNTPAGAKVDGSGCPIVETATVTKGNITDDDRKIAADAAKSLEFYSGTTVIVGYSFTNLNKLAKLLTDKNLSVKVNGYTDNLGDANINLKFSQARVDAIKTYLVNKGVDAMRIEAVGYGQAHPIAPNNTAKGRKLNNRIELTLF